MLLWEDRGELIELLKVDEIKLQEHKLFKEYNSICIKNGSVVCELANNLDEMYETIEYKILDDLFYTWKTKGLEVFCKFLKRKNIDIELKNYILTYTQNQFTYQEERELIVIEFEEDQEMEGLLVPQIVGTYQISTLSEGYSFINVEEYDRFISKKETLLSAVSDFITWYKNGKITQTTMLYSTSMIAEKFGKARQNVHKYFKEGRLPAPFAIAGSTPYWHEKQLSEIARVFSVNVDNN